mmetsp:Transcript_11590/g.29334  ORF Transcript_11590/g.29334 Transcript_11590/m.29334 type:complete len:203 (+) Transcript_11590:339-947(+)
MIPAAPHMAKRPLAISCAFNRSALSASPAKNPRGSNPKSPGARSPDSRPLVAAIPEKASANMMKIKEATMYWGWAFHNCQKASIWLGASAISHPGAGPKNSTWSVPATANIATRACLSSASRSQYKSTPTPSMLERPRGSNPTSPAMDPSRSAGRFMKGSALLRSAFNETKDCCCVTVGAKAEADAERRARTAADFIMVVLI